MTTLATSAQNLKRVCVPMMAVAPEQEPKGKVTVETRFGVIEFDRSSTLTFPKGIPGFKDFHEFGMTKLPGSPEANLVLLQSIEPSELSFIVCCYEIAAGLIDAEDIGQACQSLGIEPKDCAIVVIANFHRNEGGVRLSVNLRAPILIDTANRLAWQHILSNEKYDVRHMLD
jgi:flagellar assembly factor FliW